MPLFRFSWAPPEAPPVQRANFRFVQLDAAAVGIASSAATFLPVFLTRLGATNFEVGLLTSLPALTGLFLAVVVGNYMQRRRHIVPWLGITRLIGLSYYLLVGLVTFFVPQERLVALLLLIYAVVTLPATAQNIAFSVVMSHVAGPARRLDLMSRRWSVVGVTYAVAVAAAGVVLDRIAFPLNYQLVFIGLSLFGVGSFYFSNRIQLPASEPPALVPGLSPAARARSYLQLVLAQRNFIRVTIQRFAFLAGSTMVLPLFPLYYVRDVHASNAWIGVINTVQTGLMLFGYIYWARTTRRRGSRFVLAATTLALSLHPALAGLTVEIRLIALLAGLSGIFQAGMDLVMFDELMRTIPPQHSTTFVSFDQSLQYLAIVLAPLAGTLLADRIGLAGALIVGAGVRLAGVALYLLWAGPKTAAAPVEVE